MSELKDSKEFMSFSRGYYEAMLWASTDEAGESFDHFSVSDIDPEQVEEHNKELLDFMESNKADLEIYYQLYGGPEYAGHDFYLTRNHHGAGFWDRGTDPVFQRLTQASHPYGECQVYQGVDLKLYIE